MQTKHPCVLIHIWTKGEVSAPWNWLKPSSKIVLLIVLLLIIYVISALFLLCSRARLFIVALSPPAWKGLTSWLSFVIYNGEVFTFPLVSWVRWGAWLCCFLIFALFLNFGDTNTLVVSRLVKQCMSVKTVEMSFSHILTDGVDIQKAPLVTHASLEQNYQVNILAISCKQY